MKISHMLNTLPKRIITSAFVALAVLVPVAKTAADAVTLASTSGVANVSTGSASFENGTTASQDQVVKLQVHYQNTEAADSGKTATNVRVKVDVPSTPGASQTQTVTVSGDNTNTVTNTTTVMLDRADAYLQYVPGSALWRHVDAAGSTVDTAVSDAVFSGTSQVLEEAAAPGSEASLTVQARVMVPAPLAPVQTTDSTVAPSQSASTTTAAAVTTTDAAVDPALARTASKGCDDVNIVYCGLSGSGEAGYIASVKNHYNNNTPSDFKQIANWGNWDGNVAGMDAGNTKVGVLHSSTGNITVDGRVVATDTWMSARFTEGAGYVQIKPGVWARKVTPAHTAHATYTVLIRFNADGKAVAGIAVDCGNIIKFNPTQPPKPELVCKGLEYTLVPETRRVKFVATANAKNTTIRNFQFVFGDGEHEYVKTDKETASTAHVYAAWNHEYTARVLVNSTDIKDESGKNCVVKFKTPEKPKVPTVQITKTVNKDPVKVGENFVYTVVVKNIGETVLKNAVVNDDAPANVMFVSADIGTVTANGKNWSTTIGTLAVGASKTFQITAKVTKYVADPIVNTACVNAPAVNPSHPEAWDDCDDAVVHVLQSNPAVGIEKTVSKNVVEVGENFAYTVKVTNTGDETLKNVKVTDTPEDGSNIKLVSANGVGSISGNTWTYTIPSLKVGESKSFTLTAKVTKFTTGNLVNTACVNAPAVNPSHPEKQDACDDVPVTVIKHNPDVDIEKTVSKDTLKVGEEFTYTVKVTNTGDVDLHNAVVTDKAPGHITFLSADAGTVNTVGTAWTTTIASLAIGESKTFHITAKVASYSANTIVNTACVNTPEVNPEHPSKPDACDDVPVVVVKEHPSVTIDKVVEKPVVTIGDNYKYTVKVTNDGKVDLTNVKVSDTPATGSNILLVSANGVGSISGNTWTYTIPSLKVGESKSFTLTAKVTKYTKGELVNNACVNAPAVNPEHPNKPDACDEVPVTVTKPEVPVYACNMLTLVAGTDRTLTAKVDFTAENAELKTVTYNWGDNSTPFVTDETSADYQYSSDGTYSVSVKLLFNVDGSDVYAAENASCIKTVTYTTPDTPGTVEGDDTTTPSVLPNTGAGSVIGLFGLVSVLSAFGYRLFLSRKLAR